MIASVGETAKFLLLNTCASEVTIALADTERPEAIVSLARMPGRTASERLVAAIREAMSEACWRLQDLSAIGVVTGPGSFTGVRVGLSVAKGLSEAGGMPLISISALSMLGAAAGMIEGRVCALLDAGREEFYCGEFLDGLELGESLLSKTAGIEAVNRADVVAVCDAVTVRTFSELESVRMLAEPTAADALPFVIRRFEAGDFDDAAALDANYLRRTDAEIFAKPAAQKLV
jgi:tRNA threonylcarbamoyladenosine biosynthesis protein TsaB